ncbi:uncharacterized protein TNCV_4615141 [Trichonephila clavipes]|nr:uncharacterized protein TNCV_4615141 [Trichonephila clavipes]
MVDLQKSSPKLNSLEGGFFPVSIGLTWVHDILVLKPPSCLHNRNKVDDWEGIDEWNSWFKSQVRDYNRSQDIVNLNTFKKFKTIKNYVRNRPMSMEIIITGREDREGLNEPGPNGQ